MEARQWSITGATLVWTALAPRNPHALAFLVANSLVGYWYQHVEWEALRARGSWHFGTPLHPDRAWNARINVAVHALLPAALAVRAWQRGGRHGRVQAWPRHLTTTLALGLGYLVVADLPRVYPTSRHPLPVYVAAHTAVLVTASLALRGLARGG